MSKISQQIVKTHDIELNGITAARVRACLPVAGPYKPLFRITYFVIQFILSDFALQYLKNKTHK